MPRWCYFIRSFVNSFSSSLVIYPTLSHASMPGVLFLRLYDVLHTHSTFRDADNPLFIQGPQTILFFGESVEQDEVLYKRRARSHTCLSLNVGQSMLLFEHGIYVIILILLSIIKSATYYSLVPHSLCGVLFIYLASL